MTDLRICEISSDTDLAWDAWKRIYYDSFPANERMSEPWLIGDEQRRVLAMRDGDSGEVLGVACYEVFAEIGAAALWYLAIDRNHRNERLGRVLYKEVRRRIGESGVRALVIEVEIPGGPDDEGWAARRIDWYRRRGAFLLEGAERTAQTDTGAAPMRVYVMLHTYERLGAEQCYALAEALFGDSLQRTGRLRLM